MNIKMLKKYLKSTNSNFYFIKNSLKNRTLKNNKNLMKEKAG